jgi:lipoprotein-anchoring transpeptidase ErfK/SrfK
MRRSRSAGAAALLALALLVGACSTSAASDEAAAGTDDSSPAPDDGTDVTVEQAVELIGSRELAPITPPTSQGASAVGAQVPLFPDPAATEPMFVLNNPTHEAQLLSFRVLETDPETGRLKVLLPMRPNQSTAWIDPGTVQTFPLQRHFVVDISDRTLTVYDGFKVVFREYVAVGSDATPSPLGSFYIDFSLFPAPFPEYVNGMISLAAFSEVHQTFGGGIGQLAIHGWSDPGAMGRNVSNGCIRATPDLIERLKPLVAPGTPVDIVA